MKHCSECFGMGWIADCYAPQMRRTCLTCLGTGKAFSNRPPKARKIVQIAAAVYKQASNNLFNPMFYALCNDGTVWEFCAESLVQWTKLPPIPQEDSDERS